MAQLLELSDSLGIVFGWAPIDAIALQKRHDLTSRQKGGAQLVLIDKNYLGLRRDVGGCLVGCEFQTAGLLVNVDGVESGYDSWKSYTRRTTNTTNCSDQLPLAQGISYIG